MQCWRAFICEQKTFSVLLIRHVASAQILVIISNVKQDAKGLAFGSDVG